MIGVSVLRKAQSASTKRLHECWALNGEQFHWKASTSPKPSGLKLRPPKSSSKSSSAQDAIEIEIAEVLYGMMRQPQGISKQETTVNNLLKSDSKEMNKSHDDVKSWVSSPISNSQSEMNE
ncbi:hypothetical protein QN277_003643 [Acacia crassicarpa]|uniref:Uncharacterized protein n=1 Tax=Acacia crassicarpa TaxID=499986 RepID=A0AAE1MCR3_9FABA|nr:hypothetical protein QN277_003643 [Acacia crassicarpa]